jgi:hypothetical protein
MEKNTHILVRCAGCDHNFETRRYGQQSCPICHAQVMLPAPEGVILPPEETTPEPPPPESSASKYLTSTPATSLDNPIEGDAGSKLKEFIPAFESGERGYIGGFIQTIKEIVGSPATFFVRVRVGKPGVAKVLLFGGILCTVALNFSVLYFLLILSRNQQAFLNALEGKLAGISPEDYLNLIKTILYWLIYLSPLIGFAYLILCAAMYHLVVVITTNKNRGFAATVRATAYGFTPLLLLAIPYIGQLLGGMWTLALQVIALSQVHRMGPWRAALVVLLPIAALLLLLALPMLFNGQV